MDGGVIGVTGFVAGERDIGAGLEELLPELGAFPDRLRMLPVLLDYRENASGDDSMCAAEIVVDFCMPQSVEEMEGPRRGLFTLQCQCDGLLQLLQFLGEGQISRRSHALARHVVPGAVSRMQMFQVVWSVFVC